MQTLSDYSKLLHAIASSPTCCRAEIIAIDGFMSSGKTKLANALGTDLNARVLSTDCFIGIRNGTLCYASRLRYSALRRAVTLRNKRPVILEGICLRAVARRLRLRSLLHVYVKRLSEVGLWNDGLELEDFVSSEPSAVTDDTRQLGQLSYHARHEPHKRARFVYELVEWKELRPNMAFNRTRGYGSSFGRASAAARRLT